MVWVGRPRLYKLLARLQLNSGVVYCMTLSSFKESLNWTDLNCSLTSVSFGSLTDTAEMKMQVEKVVVRKKKWWET